MTYSPAPPPRLAQPVVGQPGLFRFGGTVHYDPRRYREYSGRLWHRVGGSDESPTLIPVRERRGAAAGLGDFSVPAPLPPPPYTWSVPTGPKWVLGAIPPSLLDQARANAMQLDELKRAADPLISGTPWSTEAYIALVRRAVASPRNALFTLSRADLAILIRGVISTVSQSQILAEGLLANPAATSSQVERARRLLFTGKDVMVKLDTLLSAARTASSAAGVSGAGLGWVVPVLIAAGVVVAAVLVYQVFATTQTNVTAIAEALEACDLDEAAGRPCSGAQYQEYLRRAQEAQRALGAVPDLAALFRQAGSLLFWGGLLAIGAGLAYIAWTAEPARRNVQERLRTASMSGIRVPAEAPQWSHDRTVDGHPVFAPIQREDFESDSAYRRHKGAWMRYHARLPVGIPEADLARRARRSR